MQTLISPLPAAEEGFCVPDDEAICLRFVKLLDRKSWLRYNKQVIRCHRNEGGARDAR